MEDKFREITTGQWKGWKLYDSGTFFKFFGKKGSNPMITCSQGHFQAFDEEGRNIGKNFNTLKEALEAVGIKK